MSRRGYGTALQDAAVKFEARLEQKKEWAAKQVEAPEPTSVA
jgi:hypothetical protein